MSRLTDLIAQVKTKDPALGSDLEAEFRVLSERRVFGLNFERHRPEAVELPQRPVRKGDKVRILPPRGSTGRGDQRLWRVLRTEAAGTSRIAHLALLDGDEPQTLAVDDLVVVAEFRDPIYPGLRSTGRVERGDDKPYHTVINAENYHALQTLLYTHRGKVDCIYIDPPYNTGAKDWRYNNDYVDGEDLYRHSKWLAFMERRLLLAKELLNPADSALIVTIDEKEYLRLGMLLHQTFPEARIQMVSSVINPKGVPRDGLSRVDEYVFLLQFGTCRIIGQLQEGTGGSEVRWRGLSRTGANGIRSKSPGAYYPIFFDRDGRIVKVGDALPLGFGSETVSLPEGLVAAWPTPRPNGEDGRWSVVPDTLRSLIAQGAVRTGRVDVERRQFPIFYLTSEQLTAISQGELEVRGRDEQGALKVYYKSDSGRRSAPRTVWDKVSHSASEHGSMLLRSLIPDRAFPFPKSLYAVEDILRFFVADKPDAVILDFFAGSGTTAHAVMRLNRQDGGCRQCILVTNNEVSADEQTALRKQGLRPGDPDWEARGICDYITKPRIRAAVTGKTPSGDPVEGDYRFTDESPMAEGFEENVEFFTLTYETPWRVARNRDFAAIAPLLWLRAGAQGRRIDAVPNAGWAVAERYGVLVDLDQARPFLNAVADADNVRIVFVVTDDDRRFQTVCAGLAEDVESVRLYESYLANFEINTGRE